MTLVCETVTATRMTDLRQARDAARLADLVELRLDGVSDPDVAGALQGRTRPVIVTCRPVWEGGRFDGSEESRLRLLADALRLGAEFIDVEWMADRSALPAGTEGRWVLSHHDFAGVSVDLATRARAMHAARPGIVKIAVTATHPADCIALHRALPEAAERVAIAMGTPGLLTRVCPWLFGSCWTYGGQAAPGQLSVRAMVEELRVRDGSLKTAVFAVLSRGAQEPAWVPAARGAIADAGLDARIVPIDSEDPETFFALADEFGLAGAHVRAPRAGTWTRHVAFVGGESLAGGDVLIRRGTAGWEATWRAAVRGGPVPAKTLAELASDCMAFWIARTTEETRS